MTTEAIKALIGLRPELERLTQAMGSGAYWVRLLSSDVKKILAAIEALKPMADGMHVMVGSALLNDLRAIADTGGRRIETTIDACDKIVELIDMEARLGPASPAPSRFEIDGASQDFYDCEGSD